MTATLDDLSTDVHRAREEIGLITKRVNKLEQQLRDLGEFGESVNEHDDRLDEHERQLASLNAILGGLAKTVHSLGAQVERCTSAATHASLGIDGLAREMQRAEGERHVRDEHLHATLERLVVGMNQMLGPKATTRLPVITIAPVEP